MLLFLDSVLPCAFSLMCFLATLSAASFSLLSALSAEQLLTAFCCPPTPARPFNPLFQIAHLILGVARSHHPGSLLHTKKKRDLGNRKFGARLHTMFKIILATTVTKVRDTLSLLWPFAWHSVCVLGRCVFITWPGFKLISESY